MIPYDDLVVALTAWRARQGLPVAPSTASAASSSPATASAAQPSRGRPPAPTTPARPAARPPAEISDFEDSALVEDSYDSGEDYVLSLGDHAGEATAVGNAPDAASTPRRDKRW